MKSAIYRTLLFVLIFAALVLLSGCAQSSVPASHRWATVQGGQVDEAAAGEQFYFTVPVDQWLLDSGRPIHVEVKGNVERGALTFQLRRPDGSVLWNSGRLGGAYEIKQDIAPDANAQGDYTLGMVYEAGTSASYDLGWHSLRLSPTILLTGAGMTLAAALAAFWAVRKGGTWRMIGWGAIFWAFTVALKFAFAIPVNGPLSQALGVSYQNLWSPGNLLFYIYVGALTGIFEVVVAWLVLRNRPLGHATWRQALTFGVGFGAFEALLLGLLSLGTSLGALVAQNVLPISALGGLAANNDLLFAIAPVVERISVIFAHVFTCAAIFYAIAARQPKWMWMAALYKTVLDAPAAYAQYAGVNTLGKLWAVEGIIFVMALIAAWSIWRLSRRYPTLGDQPTVPPPSMERVVSV